MLRSAYTFSAAATAMVLSVVTAMAQQQQLDKVLPQNGAIQLAGEGLRRIEVKRFGVVVEAPLAWNLIRWGQDDQAFVLSLPQETLSLAGRVACELGLAPESLDEYRKQNAAQFDAELRTANELEVSPARKLTQNDCAEMSTAEFGPDLTVLAGRRLVSVWEYPAIKGVRRYEECVRLICHDTLYTFSLQTDEAHYDAYRLDFRQLIRSAVLTRPETGLKRLAGNYWLQQDYLFAVRLPAEWRPAFGGSDKALLFAKGATHEVFTDNLVVHASKSAPLDLDALQKSRPDTWSKADPQAKVLECHIVKQNALQQDAGQPAAASALETVVQTRRGDLAVTVVERRFRSAKRNYEVIFTVESGDYERLRPELRKSLDSFQEVTEKEPDEAI